MPKRNYRFWILCSLLFLIAVVLRWFKLDLMTFRHDQAAVAFRAMETFRSGLPLTGIVNSHGFHNGPGYIWSLIPSFLITPDPVIAAGWHGLLASTMIFPLAILGQRYGASGLKWLPAIIAAVIPASVFAGRNLWAQYLLPPVVAWTFLAFDNAVVKDCQTRRRIINAAIALALMAWATSIHFSAGLLFMILCLGLIVGGRLSPRRLILALIPAILIAMTLIPSGLDWWAKYQNPEAKPDYAEAFESVLPDPLPWYVRVEDSAFASVSNSSLEALLGIDKILEPWQVMGIQIYDGLILSLILSGGVLAIFLILRNGRNNFKDQRHVFFCLLIAWLVVPAVLGALLVKRVNAGYFLGSLPAAWLLPLAIPVPGARWVMVWRWICGFVCVGGIVIASMFIFTINREGYLNGSYYITYRDQRKVVDYINSKGVGKDRFVHLAGDWFEYSYDYIQKYVDQPDSQAKRSGMYSVMEDRNTVPTGRVNGIKYFWNQQPANFGSVGVLLFQSRGAAEIFARNYYELSAGGA